MCMNVQMTKYMAKYAIHRNSASEYALYGKKTFMKEGG